MIKITGEMKAWIVSVYWAAYWCIIGPYLISAESGLAVMIGLLLFIVGIRFSIPVLIDFHAWLAKELNK